MSEMTDLVEILFCLFVVYAFIRLFSLIRSFAQFVSSSEATSGGGKGGK